MKSIFLSTLCTLILLGGCQLNNSEPGDCIDPNKKTDNAGCIEIFEPVCGCDGNTYSNSCMAESEGVISYTEGECK